MYTECPTCNAVFRLTAKVLQQARGRVRCGGCGNAFSALDFLSEDLPDSGSTADAAGGAPPSRDSLSESSRLLLAKLDELAGSDDVLIEDTGTEWRVLNALVADIEAEALAAGERDAAEADDVPMVAAAAADDDREFEEIVIEAGDEAGEAAPDDERSSAAHTDDPGTAGDASQQHLDLDDTHSAPEDAWLFDDHTPHPETRDDDDPAPDALPQRRAGDQPGYHDAEALDTAGQDDYQTDFMLSEPGDWSDLLDEVRGDHDGDGPETAPAADATDDAGDEPSMTHAPEAEDADAWTEATEAYAADDDEQPMTPAPEDEDPDAWTAAYAADDEGDGPSLTLAPEGEDPDAWTAAPEADAADDTGDERSMSHAVSDEAAEASAAAAEEDVAGDADDLAATGDAPEDLDADPVSLEVEEELAAIHSELSGRETASPADVALRFEVQPDAAEPPLLDPPADDDGGGSERTPSDGDAKEEDTGDPDAAERARMFEDASAEVETIIMEGESIRNAMEEEQLAEPVAQHWSPAADESPQDAQEDEDAEPPFDPADTLFGNETAMRGGRRSTDPPGYGVIAGTVVFALLLAGQLIHTYRETLSTYTIFNRTIGPVYRLLGRPVTPQWDIQGWQFESTNGNVAADGGILTIVSRVSNRSETALPYPLVHVSLTDRWEEIIGSRVMAPDEYLAGDIDPDRRVVPGEEFTAVITVDDPSIEATGFKLNVCYRDTPGQVRCATEDFKD